MKPSEKAFTQTVKEYAELRGWLFYHPWKSYHSAKGFPDCTMIRPPRVVFAELKVGKNKRTDYQVMWGDALERCPGVEYYVWRPSDWEEIEKALL